MVPRPCFGVEEGTERAEFLGVLALGEGWHNNHHAFPTSARHGFKWWQIDFSYWVIQLLVFCRLAWAVKKPVTRTAIN